MFNNEQQKSANSGFVGDGHGNFLSEKDYSSLTPRPNHEAEDIFANLEKESAPRPVGNNKEVNFSAPLQNNAPLSPAKAMGQMENFAPEEKVAGGFKYLAIGIISLIILLVVGIFVYQKILKPHFENSLAIDNNLQTEQSPASEVSLQNNNTQTEQTAPVEQVITPAEVAPEQVVTPEETSVTNDNTEYVPVDNNTNPEITVPETEMDSDGDGLTDAQEEELGTNKNSIDSDGDGLSDKEEVEIYETMPLDPDTDGDGYSDGQEVKAGYNPNGPGKLLIKK